jgi:hypothetical protein
VTQTPGAGPSRRQPSQTSSQIRDDDLAEIVIPIRPSRPDTSIGGPVPGVLGAAPAF